MIDKDNLYLEKYAAGHLKGCEMAIPELRRNIFTKCICSLIRLKERISPISSTSSISSTD